jgi:hypothetical protein
LEEAMLEKESMTRVHTHVVIEPRKVCMCEVHLAGTKPSEAEHINQVINKELESKRRANKRRKARRQHDRSDSKTSNPLNKTKYTSTSIPPQR